MPIVSLLCHEDERELAAKIYDGLSAHGFEVLLPDDLLSKGQGWGRQRLSLSKKCFLTKYHTA